MTEARPKGASTGRLLLDQLVDRVPGREVVGHDRVDGQMHSVDKCRLAGRGLGWAAPVPPRSWPPRCRPQDPEQAGVIDDLRDHLPAAVALHRYYERDVVSQMLQSITRTLAESNSSSSGARTKSAALI